VLTCWPRRVIHDADTRLYIVSGHRFGYWRCRVCHLVSCTLPDQAKIDISRDVRKAPNDNTYQIKVINRRRRAALNVRAQLHLITPKCAGEDVFTNSISIPLRRSELMQLSGRDRRHKGAAVFRFLIEAQFSTGDNQTETDLGTLLNNHPNSYLAFRIG
jgi:hypothetical protein